jgi:hypothetical protein
VLTHHTGSDSVGKYDGWRGPVLPHDSRAVRMAWSLHGPPSQDWVGVEHVGVKCTTRRPCVPFSSCHQPCDKNWLSLFMVPDISVLGLWSRAMNTRNSPYYVEDILWWSGKALCDTS